jgi:hypothetical protein
MEFVILLNAWDLSPFRFVTIYFGAGSYISLRYRTACGSCTNKEPEAIFGKGCCTHLIWILVLSFHGIVFNTRCAVALFVIWWIEVTLRDPWPTLAVRFLEQSYNQHPPERCHTHADTAALIAKLRTVPVCAMDVWMAQKWCGWWWRGVLVNTTKQRYEWWSCPWTYMCEQRAAFRTTQLMFMKYIFVT